MEDGALRARGLVSRHPAHQLPHQRLGHAAVHVVHRDQVRGEGPEAQGQLRQVRGADHQALFLVGHVHEDLRPLPGLEVLEGEALAVGGVEGDVPDVLLAGGPDVDLAQLDPHGLGQAARVGQRAAGGPEARHGHGQHAVAA